MTHQGPDTKIEGVSLGWMSIDKQYRGDVEGSSGKGEMLAAFTTVLDSFSRLRGHRAHQRNASGRSGIFLLRHTGTMTSGA